MNSINFEQKFHLGMQALIDFLQSMDLTGLTIIERKELKLKMGQEFFQLCCKAKEE